MTSYSLTFHRLSRTDLERLVPAAVEWLDRPDVDVEIRLVDDDLEGYTPEPMT